MSPEQKQRLVTALTTKPPEDDYLADLWKRDPIAADRLEGEIALNQKRTPEENAAAWRDLGELALSVAPVTGNIMSARDAYQSGSDAVKSFGEGNYKRAGLEGLMAALSGAGAVVGVPWGKMAGKAAKAGKSAVFSGAAPIDDLPMDEASRMARAKEMGIRTGMPLYHGTNQDIPAFDLTRGGQTSGSRAGSMGVSVALDPDTAAEFADLAAGKSGSGQNIVRLLHRADRPAVVDLTGNEKNLEIAGTLQDAWDNGYDAVMMRNYTTPGGQGGRTILVVKDPAQLRSPNAKYDPAKRNSSDLLAGAAGASLLPAWALLQSSATSHQD